VTSTELAVPENRPDAALTAFDYSTLSADVANEMRDCASRIRRLQRASVLEVGRELIAAKELVEHGFFRDWVKTACQMHIRTAERLMQSALLVKENDKLSYLPPDGLVALAARSAPEPVINAIIGEIAAGERPSAAWIKRRIAQAKQAEKRARGSLQEDELRGEEGCEHGQEDAATTELIAMLITWHRFDEFVILLRKADLSSLAQALGNLHDRLATISVTEGEPVLLGTLQTPLAPHSVAKTTRDCTKAPAEAPPPAPQELAGKAATSDSDGTIAGPAPEVAAPGLLNDVSAEELSAIWGSLKRNTRWYGRQWVADGCPITSHRQENPVITESLLLFRAAASKASDAELQRFLNITAPQAA
jgi:hypothetical protein